VGSVEGLQREDVVQFLAGYYTPDNCILIVCGDVDKKTIQTWAGKYFGKWRGNTKSGPADERFQPVNGKEVLLLNKEDATQTQIRVGLPGLPIEHPDFHAFEVARTIYAGSFTSRLMNEIRVNRGLSYGVGCWSNRFAPGGIIYVYTFTKNETVGEVLEIILTEADRMQTEPVPDSELVGGINYRTGLYPLNFETSDDMVSIFSNLWLHDLDKSRYEDYQEKLKAVTAEQAMATAGKYFPKENYRVVLVGKADEVKQQAEMYGPVTVREISTE
jgi:zinc protease